MHAEAVPVGIEDLMGLEQRCDARARGTWQELEERGQVFRAHALRGERGVAQGVRVACGRRERGEPREVPCWREGVGGRGRVKRVHAPQ